MFLELDDLGAEGLHFERSLSLPRVAREHPDFVEAPTVALRGQLRPGPSGADPAESARLEGECSGTLQLRCGRCLEGFSWALRTRFRFVLVSRIPGTDEMESDASEKAHFFQIVDRRLALEDLASEQVDLALPLKPVCSAECRGLCPTCGVNRNRLECDCREGELDPRWEALQAFRERMRDD